MGQVRMHTMKRTFQPSFLCQSPLSHDIALFRRVKRTRVRHNSPIRSSPWRLKHLMIKITIPIGNAWSLKGKCHSCSRLCKRRRHRVRIAHSSDTRLRRRSEWLAWQQRLKSPCRNRWPTQNKKQTIK